MLTTLRIVQRGIAILVLTYLSICINCTSFDPDLIPDDDASVDSDAEYASVDSSIDANDASISMDAFVEEDTAPPPTAQCDTTGGGKVVDNYAWFRGSAGQSCTTVCTGKGGYNDATLDYAGYASSGPSGTINNCAKVAQAFVGTSLAFQDTTNASEGLGCVYRISNPKIQRYINTTTTNFAANPSFERFCACGSDCFP